MPPRAERTATRGAFTRVSAFVVCFSAATAWTPGDVRAEPAAAVTTTRAQVVEIDDLKKAVKSKKGRVVLVHFWASWCLPCLEELPVMGRLARELKPRGVDVLSFSLDAANDANADKVGKLIGDRADNALTRQIVRVGDPDVFINAIDPQWEGTIPALFAYDSAGHLKGSLIGESSRDEIDKFVTGVQKADGKGSR